MALPTLAALAPGDVDVTIADEQLERIEPYLSERWDVVGITGYFTHRDRMLKLAEVFRRHGNLVAIGGPYANQEALRQARKRQNLRPDLIADTRAFQRRGIGVEAGIVTGFDADTKESFRVQLEFLQQAGIPAVLVNMLLALEGTPLERRLPAEDRLRTLNQEDGYTGTNIIPKQMTVEELQYGTQWLLNKLYAPDAFLQRVAVLAKHSPEVSAAAMLNPQQSALVWKNLLRAYADLGVEFRRVPGQGVKLFHGKDVHVLGLPLIIHVHNVRILRKQGLWNPTLAELEAPDFESLGETDGPAV
jgi:hypothetical protein